MAMTGTFGELPGYSRSQPLGGRTEKNGVMGESYKAPGGIRARRALGSFGDRGHSVNGVRDCDPVAMGACTVVHEGRMQAPQTAIGNGAGPRPVLAGTLPGADTLGRPAAR
jgi:hypothetical protein